MFYFRTTTKQANLSVFGGVNPSTNEVVASWRKTAGGWTKLLCFSMDVWVYPRKGGDLSLSKIRE